MQPENKPIPLSYRGILPDWVPASVEGYIAHTHYGLPLRKVASFSGCHPSTILRRIRQTENRRDDVLVDEALDNLGEILSAKPIPAVFEETELNSLYESNDRAGTADIDLGPKVETSEPTKAEIERQARRVLRRLCEVGAFLAASPQAGRAVVFRSSDSGEPVKIAVVDRRFAQIFALNDWISCTKSATILRYSITSVGRAYLKRLISDDRDKRISKVEEVRVDGFQEQHRIWGKRTVIDKENGRPRKIRANLAESPLTSLARKKGKSGDAFLSSELVQAGERLREDFELSQMGARITQNWDRFLASGRSSLSNDGGILEGPTQARNRVAEAVHDLGPGLSDIVLRCCCFLEGLEAAEKRLGWSARSGKIVLRIALQRLHRHYTCRRHTKSHQMIG
jgi:hypothetical protein